VGTRESGNGLVTEDEYDNKTGVMLTGSHVQRGSQEKAVKSTTNYIFAMASNEADTFLRSYSSNDFYALGSVWKGGEINYIGVGAFNTVYTNELSSSFLNPIETVAWNVLQSILRLSSSDLSDVPANLFWMNYGSTHGK